MTSIIIILIIYLAVLFGIGVYYSRKSKNMTDFLLAGRGLKLVPAVLTMTATLFGGGLLTGAAQYAYLNGTMIYFYPLCNLLGVCGVGLLIKKMSNFFQYSTVSEYLEDRYGSPFLRSACALLSMIALIGILGSQVAAVTGILNAIGFPNPTLCAVGAMAIIIALTVMGGLWAVTMTDCFQILLVILGVIWISVVAIGHHGGFGGLMSELSAAASSLPENYAEPINGAKFITLSWMILPFVMYCLIGQDLYQRLFACKTEKVARQTAYLSGIILTLLTMLPVTLGLIARLDFPELAVNGTSAAAFATVAMAYLPDFAIGIILAATLSAILSTADSMLTAATSHFINDFFIPFAGKNEDPNGKKMLNISRLASLVIGVISVFVSMAVPEILTAMIYSYTIYTAGAFIPIVMGVLWKKTTKEGAIAGLISGSLFAVIGLSGFTVGAVPGELFSAFIAAAVTAVVSLATAKRREIEGS